MSCQQIIKTMNKTILITGANSGLGKDAARQAALLPEVEKIYLACRNLEKAKAAQKELEEVTGKKIFEILILDTADLSSVERAVNSLQQSIDALIMNAGGMGGKTPEALTKDGVTQIFATNVLGHVLLVNELLKADKLKNVAMYASSEAVRGIEKMDIPQPKLKSYSISEFQQIIDGSYFEKWDAMAAYAHTKLVATLWMSALARRYENIRFISVSPGATSGTQVMENLKGIMKFMFKYVLMPIVMPLRGMVHKLEVGAKRYIDAISDDSYESGKFYASEVSGTTGPLVEQSPIFPDLSNEQYQDNALEAIERILNTAQVARAA